MKGFWLALAVALLSFASAHAQEGDGAEIRAVISDQIAAFQLDDFAAAFEYASPGIRRIFETSERFAQMVRSGYPMVHRPAGVEYLDLQEIDGALWQMVEFEDQSGRRHVLGYQMIHLDDAWKINAVHIFDLPELAV